MTRRAFVAGAGGAVGEAAALTLLREGWAVTASMRTPRDDVGARLSVAGAEVAVHDLARDDSWIQAAERCEALVFTPHLAVTRAALEGSSFTDRRIVVFSSNNVAADAEAPSYRALADAERAVRTRFAHCAIIRPTLIYGDPRLITVTRLMRMAQKWPVLPLPGSGRARVQPVFHGDLGRLAAELAIADAPRGVFAVGGPDVVTMRELYVEVARAAQRRRVIVPVRPAWLKAAGVFSEEQAARAEADRTSIAQDPLPPRLAPQTTLREGLNHLAALLRSASAQAGG